MRLLERADQVVVPSADVARRLARHAPALRIGIEPHDEVARADVAARPPRPAGGPLRVLTVGAISRIKGFEVLRRLAESARGLALPIEFALLGYSMDDMRLSQVGVTLLGRYFDNELSQRIDAYDPDVILIPSIWPETYCYVLSGALASGRSVAVFDIGAQADRVREHGGRHLVLPLALVDDGAALAQALLDGAGRSTEPSRQAA
jgi:glycosyltransferase involved in cell wall biosynthesis